MAIIINGIDADDSVRKDFTVVSVTFSDSFKVDYVGDGVHEIQVLCDYTTPTPPYETPTLTPSTTPAQSYTNTPSVTPPFSPTEEPMSWYCVSLSDYPEPDCAGSPEVSVVCQQGIDIDWETVGDCFNLGDTSYVVDIIGGPYETRVNCEAACIITPTPTPSLTPAGCCAAELTSSPFASEEAAQDYASTHGVEYAGCQDLTGCPDCDVDDQGCIYYFSDIVEIEGAWYVKYAISENNCHECTPTPTISPTPEDTANPDPQWYCYKWDDAQSNTPVITETPDDTCACSSGIAVYKFWTYQSAVDYAAANPMKIYDGFGCIKNGGFGNPDSCAGHCEYGNPSVQGPFTDLQGPYWYINYSFVTGACWNEA